MQLLGIMTVVTALSFGSPTLTAAEDSGQTPVQSVAQVDQSHFMGRWYQIARLPNRFQKGCAGHYTDFSLRDDGHINVVNSCRNDKDGSLRQAKGQAWVADPANSGRLKVSFFWPFRSDYWIIGLGNQYQYSIIASPDRKFLWILSRTATMSDDLYASIVKDVEHQGFAVGSIIKEVSTNRGPAESL
jgi:apolipoprotein D and lipocalin family protein